MEDKEINYPSSGMNFSHPSDLKPGEFSLMVNGQIESISGDWLKVSNTQSNLLCSRLKNFKLIGVNYVASLGVTFLFLVDSTNPSGVQSEIGFIYDQVNEDTKDSTTHCKDCNNPIIEDTPLEQTIQIEKCNYNTFVSAQCLNFSVDFPIQSWVKVDDCSVRIYFTDGNNPPRYIDYNNWQTQNINISNCPLITTNELDCDKIKIFKESCYPIVQPIDVVSGGENTAGVYEFVACYADVRANKITDYFYVSNPVPLFQQQITIANDYPIAKSIKLSITNVNTDFKYLNLVVLKTVNGTTTPYLIETIQIASSSFDYLYTGISANIPIKLSIDEIIGKRPVYTSAVGLSESNGYLFLDNLKEQRILNLQPSVLDLPVYWQTVQLEEGDYVKPIIASSYVGYLGDEVYPLGISFTRSNGQQTAIFTIPGREINANDQIIINNNDVLTSSSCTTTPLNQNWQVYNTAFILNSSGANPSGTQSTTIVPCTSDEFQVDSLGQTLDLQGNPINLLGPSGVCASCLQSITQEYTQADGITLTSITDITNPAAFNLISPSGYTYVKQYSETQTLPWLNGFPYNTTPCFTDGEVNGCLGYPPGPVPNNGSFIDTKTNTYWQAAYNIPQNYNSQCTPDTGTQYGSFLTNPSGTTSLTNGANPNPIGNSTNGCVGCIGGGDDRNQSWFSFVASNTISAISVFVQASIPYIEVWAQDPITGQIYSIKKDGSRYSLNNLLDPITWGASYTNNGYNLYRNLTIGTTYFVKVYNSTGDTSGPGAPCNSCAFRICVTTPSPNGPPVRTYKNAFYTLNCTYRVNYTSDGFATNPCFISPYKHGEMSYWESTELYPCNTELFGDLAGKPIRHHKFPDNLVSPFFKKTNTGFGLSRNVDSIYPKGFRISVADIKQRLLQAELQGLISSEERQSICGYRIYRGNRRGNEGIIAKGLLTDVWSYKDNVYGTQDNFLFSNFPYNDNNDNKFIARLAINNVNDVPNGNNGNTYLQHPNAQNNYVNNQYTFNAPNLSFNNPGLGVELKLECAQLGNSQGTYQDVKNNSRYQYLGPGVISAAIGFASIETGFEALQVMAQATLALPIQVFGSGTSLPLGLILALVGENIAAPGLLLKHYGDYYDLISKFCPFLNYASYYTSVGVYDNYLDVPNNAQIPNKRRAINFSQYLQPGILNVKTGNPSFPTYQKFNNYNRESTVFVDINNTFLPINNSRGSLYDTSRFVPKSSQDWKTQVNKPIASYYGSMKNLLLNQYGTLDSIEWLDTGYNGRINWNNPFQDNSHDTIFGGDTFINRYARKTKIPFFLEDRVTAADAQIPVLDNSDIILSLLPNIGYPVYFMDYPTALNYNPGVVQLFGQVAMLNDTHADYNFSNKGSTGQAWADGGLAAAILGSLAGVAFGVVSLTVVVAAIEADVHINLGNDVYLNGKYFHSCYGIPSFLVESNYNLDYRIGRNTKAQDFYPHVADYVTWTQQYWIPISEDNYYFYNNDYSKQNHENPGFILNNDYKRVVDDCKSNHPNRVIYSLQDNDQNDKYDGNLIFLANNYFDFPKGAGKLSAVKGIDNNKVIVLQENQASVFNSYISSTNVEIPQTTVGSNQIFNKAIPAQFVKTDLGYGGSQTPAFVSTEFGQFWVDNKRGQIINYAYGIKDYGIKDIIKPEDAWWFKENLPFRILKDFPNAIIDNNYKYIGMTMTYDARYKRIFITKRDAELYPQYRDFASYSNGEYYYKDQIILPTDPTYFCNRSWTISYSPITKSFVSFHSSTPNYYIANQAYFQGGFNYSPTNDLTDLGLWSYNLTSKSYQVYEGKIRPFIIQFSKQSKADLDTLSYIEYISEFQRFKDNTSFAVITNKTFNKAFVTTSSQSTGTLELVVRKKNDLFQMLQYPTQTPNSIKILTENISGIWSFNGELNDKSLANGNPLLTYSCGFPYNDINPNSISYAPRFLANLIKSDYFNVRLINDIHSNYKIVNRFDFINSNDKKI